MYLRVFLLLLLTLHARAALERLPQIDDAHIHKVICSRSEPSHLMVLAQKTLYLSRNDGDSFQRYMRTKNGPFTDAIVEHSTSFYVSDTRHIFHTSAPLDPLFTTHDNHHINALAMVNNHLYAATSQGLYLQSDSPRIWDRLSSFKHESIHLLQIDTSHLYVLSESGLYRLHEDHTFDLLFASRYRNDPSDESDEATSHLLLQTFHIDLFKTNHLWLGTSKGLIHSADHGETWRPHTLTDIGTPSIYHLAQDQHYPHSLYLCTEKGLYIYDTTTQETHALYADLPTSHVYWIDFDRLGNLYIVTEQGIYHSARKDEIRSESKASDALRMEALLRDEPPIRDIQLTALLYNSIHPDKIKGWQQRIKYRALLPEVTIDYDKTIGSSFTQSGHYYAEGPYDWGLNFKWDMKDLLWNDAENTADTRDRLTTQLRIDIIDDINRLYYERIRLKREIALSTADEERFAHELRLHEITAALDGYTGGYVSTYHEKSK